jgi:hypothetical protein
LAIACRSAHEADMITRPFGSNVTVNKFAGGSIFSLAALLRLHVSLPYSANA